MKYHKGRLTTPLYLVFFWASSAVTSAFETEVDPFSISLAELITTEVTVASRIPEKWQDSSSSVSSWQYHQIHNLGYDTLAQLASITPGYSTYTIYGEQVFETRGQKAGSFENNKHLLLIDDIPISHARAGKVSTEYELPLIFAENVEFLRGPASAIYGTGAFLGVINIQPLSLDRPSQYQVHKIASGSNDHDQQFSITSLNRSEQGQSRVYASHYQKEASNDFVGNIPNDQHRYHDNQKSDFLYAAYDFLASDSVPDTSKRTDDSARKITFGVLYSQKTGGLGEYWNGSYSHPLNNLQWETFIPYIKWIQPVGDNLKISTHLKYNQSIESGHIVTQPPNNYDGTGVNFAAYKTPVREYSLQSMAQLKTNQIDQITFGVSGEYRYRLGGKEGYEYLIYADPGIPYQPNTTVLTDSTRLRNRALFLQLQHQLPWLSGTIVTAGARHDVGISGKNRFSQLSPRLSVVQKFNRNWSFRLSHASALRSPGIKELGLNELAKSTLLAQNQPISAIKDLTAETLTSSEASINYHREKSLGSITFFSNSTRHPLNASQYLGENIFINGQGKTDSRGMEFEYRFQASAQLSGFANISWSRTQDEYHQPQMDVPVTKKNAGLTWHHESLAVTATIQNINHFRGANPLGGQGYTLIDSNLEWKKSAQVRYGIKLKNIGNRKYYLPKNARDDIPMPERHIQFWLEFSL